MVWITYSNPSWMIVQQLLYVYLCSFIWFQYALMCPNCFNFKCCNFICIVNRIVVNFCDFYHIIQYENEQCEWNITVLVILFWITFTSPAIANWKPKPFLLYGWKIRVQLHTFIRNFAWRTLNVYAVYYRLRLILHCVLLLLLWSALRMAHAYQSLKTNGNEFIHIP